MTTPRLASSLIAMGFALALGGCAGAVSTQTAAVVAPAAPVTFWEGFRDHPHGYLTAENTPNAANFLPPPPAEGSLREQADIAAYREMRALEGTERWEIARADNEIETPGAPRAFDCALGFKFEPEKMPTLTLLMGKMLGDLEMIQTWDAGKFEEITLKHWMETAPKYLLSNNRAGVPDSTLGKIRRS